VQGQLSKKEIVLEYLNGQIEAGAYQGGLLPKERELAVQLGVSRKTIRAALDILEMENKIVRTRHVGTRVRTETLAETSSVPDIGILCRTSGHVYETFYKHLLKYLSDRGCTVSVVPTDILDRWGSYTPKSMKYAVEKLLRKKPHAWIIDGYRSCILPHFSAISSGNTVFFDFIDGHLPKDGFTGVWIDYTKVGYLGAKFLLDHGCRRPMLIPPRIDAVTRYDPEILNHHCSKLICGGFSKALEEAGLDPMTCILDPYHGHSSARNAFYCELLSNRQICPDGIMFYNDYQAFRFQQFQKEFGISTNQRPLLLGCNNTPWSSYEAEKPFSSIEKHYDLCAEYLAEQVMLPPEKRKDIYITPEVIDRSGGWSRQTEAASKGRSSDVR